MSQYRITHDKYLSSGELEDLKNTLLLASNSLTTESRFIDLRDTLLISLLLTTGSRASEILGVRCEDYSPLNKTIEVRGLKGSNDRTCFLPSQVVRLLDMYIASSSMRPRQHLFDITYKQLTRVWSKFNPTCKGVHSLRHTFAIELYKRTRDIRLVGKCLGHRSINNTMVYLDFIESSENMHKLIWGE